MKIKKSIWMLGIAAVLASCSQEEMLQGTGNNGVTTITVNLEDGIIKTRVAADSSENAGIDRYVFEAYESDGTTPANIFNDETSATYTATTAGGQIPSVIAKLDKEKTYKIYCWADEGDESSYNTESGLSSITLKDDAIPTIAHRGMADVSGTEARATINLTHAVGKVVLQTTSDITNASVAVSTSTSTGYNALTGTYVTESLRTIEESVTSKTITGATSDAPQEVLSFYTLVGEQAFSTTITYNANYATTLNNVPYQADYRTVLRGDLYGMQYGNTAVTATLDEDWEEENIDNFITLTAAGQLSSDKIAAALSGGGNTLHISGPLDNEDISVLKNYLADSPLYLSLDLSGVEVAYLREELPMEAFSDCQRLVSIILPEGLTDIGYMAFSNCSSLTNVTLPSTLTLIGGRAFSGANALETISTPKGSSTGQFPDGLSDIGEYAFQGNGIRNIDLSNTEVGIIYEYLFSGASVETVKLGNVTRIDEGAFSGCNNLTQLDLSSCSTWPTFTTESGIYPFDRGASLKIKVLAEQLEAAQGCNLVTDGILTADQFVTEF